MKTFYIFFSLIPFIFILYGYHGQKEYLFSFSNILCMSKIKWQKRQFHFNWSYAKDYVYP